ncbi:MAG: alpha/beta hydrolase-fold protein [Weeksellaceae bacterium]
MIFNLTSLEVDDRDIYITGDFNNWNPKDPNFKMRKVTNNHFELEIDKHLFSENSSYKYTKGGWENVELNALGYASPNRRIDKSSKTIHDTVPKWRLNWGPFKKEYFPIVELVSEEFFIPQLDKTRKVWALLPHDYYRSHRKYPVLYLQDAQNLFREGSAFGNWEIDKKLSVLAEYGRGDIIVIAVEHGGEDRIKEYVFENPKLTQSAEGKKYVRFVTDTLKPYIDSKYRTLKDRDNTGIGGSSLGALISIYCGVLYPEVYSKLLLFSPSLWVEPENNYPLVGLQEQFHTKVYIYGGKQEGSQMTNRVKSFENVMLKWQKMKLFDFEIRTVINEDGQHQEFFWSQEFPKAVEWLYFDSKEDPLVIIEKAYHAREKTYDLD